MTEEVMEWRVLAVDDEREKLDDLENVLSSRMDNNRFIFTKVTSFDEATKLIVDGRFDLIFLDVHEEPGDPPASEQPRLEDQKGELVLHHLQSVRFLPVIFYTGYPAKVSHLQSMVVKVVDKGTGIDEIRAAVNEVLETKLPHLLRYIEEQSRSYIWESLSELIKIHEDDINTTDISLLLARRLAGSLSQNIVKGMLGMDVKNINPLEMYQYPPSDESCNPGDIYEMKSDKSLWMVFTPACDFEQNKADNILLARIVPLVEHPIYSSWVEKTSLFDEATQDDRDDKEEAIKAAKKAMKDARGDVKSLVKGRSAERYRFLPSTFFIPACVVDFQDLINFPKESKNNFEVKCSLDNPYREEMLYFFSKYYGRIGTPDYDTGPIWEVVDREFKSR